MGCMGSKRKRQHPFNSQEQCSRERFSFMAGSPDNGRSGKFWTWDANGTTDKRIAGKLSTVYMKPEEKIKGNAQQVTPTYLQILFPAFYWTGQYPLVKRQESQAAGLSQINGLV